MAWVQCIGICIGCKQTFTFNPVRVPSVIINGTREPFCGPCVARANPVRIANGLDPIVPLRDAYESCDEMELPE